MLRIRGAQDRRVQIVLSAPWSGEAFHGTGTTRTGDSGAAKLDGRDDQRLGTRIRVVGLHPDGTAAGWDSSLALLSYGEQEESASIHVAKTSSLYSLVIYALLVETRERFICNQAT